MCCFVFMFVDLVWLVLYNVMLSRVVCCLLVLVCVTLVWLPPPGLFCVVL